MFNMVDGLRKIRLCGPIGRGLSLGVSSDISKPSAPSCDQDVNYQLLLQCPARVPTAMLPTVMVLD